jgi:hypothetical protein
MQEGGDALKSARLWGGCMKFSRWLDEGLQRKKNGAALVDTPPAFMG